jgi:hypothetical protein
VEVCLDGGTILSATYLSETEKEVGKAEHLSPRKAICVVCRVSLDFSFDCRFSSAMATVEGCSFCSFEGNSVPHLHRMLEGNRPWLNHHWLLHAYEL